MTRQTTSNRPLWALIAAFGILLALAGCTSSSSGSSSAAAKTLQFRPVLTEKPSAGHHCPSAPPANPTPTAVIVTCSTDGTTWYQLGPAALTHAQVQSLQDASDSSQGPVVTVNLTNAGNSDFSALTGKLNDQNSPRNQFAILINGKVQESPQITEGAITGGQAEISFASTADLDAFLGKSSHPSATAATPTSSAAKQVVLVDKSGVGPATLDLSPIPAGLTSVTPVGTCSGDGNITLSGGPIIAGHPLVDSTTPCVNPVQGVVTLTGPVTPEAASTPLTIQVGSDVHWHVRITAS